MSHPFEDHLRKIHQIISLEDGDREPYINIYNEIRDALLNEICEADLTFKQLYAGHRCGESVTIGRYMHKVCLKKPNEFDVFFILKMPYGHKLTISKDKKRPGFVRLGLRRVLPSMPSTINLNFLLKSAILIEKIIEFSISTPVSSWYAVPNPLKNKRLDCPGNSFQLINPNMEDERLSVGSLHVGVVYRLVKSLRDRNQIRKLTNTFLVSIFLWETKKRPDNFWQKPISEVFLEILKVLLTHIQTRKLPYFWNPEHNLIHTLEDEEVASYATALDLLFCLLQAYRDQSSLAFHDCARLFRLLHKV
uniref:Mab-21 domain-containing protein n=1 Tax=Glossina brevipalpis TaxID=37001 RepID=A0A1A9WQI4_9MUSC